MMDLMNHLSASAVINHRPLGEKGEDAYQFDFSDPLTHMQSVFDGCGGAGAWKYPEFRNATGAYVAAQCMAMATRQWLSAIPRNVPLNAPQAAEGFRQMAANTLGELKAKCAPMGVAGSLVKSFPCTVSAAIMQMHRAGYLNVTALNTGDSRVYILTPETGLVQLTKDDSRGNPDPLESLRDSAPLSNLLNADKPFTVTPSQIDVPLPCAVICATDGMFGFLRSPMDFEHILLSTLVNAKTIQVFETAFQNRIARVTGDDSTCVASFYGWKDMDELRADMKVRADYVSGLVSILDDAGDDRARMEKAVIDQWQTYRQSTLYYELQE